MPSHTSLAALFLLTTSLSAQQPPAQDCSGARYREFDFWVGEWEVTSNSQRHGSVRQLWEQSRDAGSTWTVAFDGLYRRR